jgi:16S rRNA (guanine527-N7)-methyltransferase
MRLLGLTLTDRQREAFAWYLDELLRWNARQNLTAVVDPVGITIKHFLDSLTLVPRLGAMAAGRMVDVGTGAGFPGLPVRIVCSGLRLVLVEATEKKAEFCRHVAEGLALKGVEVLHARAEEFGRDPNHRQAYDVATARAVAALPVLLEYLLPLVRVGGRVLAQKGENAPAEAQQSQRALELLGGRLRQLHAVELPGVTELRYIVEVEKTAATPEAYPRRPGVPTKRPLLG